MKKNIIKMRAYGFTLVELLATIVVIAVVSLITVPAVTAIIERTRKASFAKSAMNVNKISDNYYISNSAIFSKFNDITFDCNNVLCSSQSSPNIKNLNLGAEGAMGNGYVKIYKGGSVEFLLTNGKYCAEKNPNKEEVKIYNGNCEGIIIDNEKIRINSIKTTSTTSTIKVFGDVITGKSGVSKYEFYIDNKLDATVKTNDTNYTHTFEKVSGKNHKIRVKVYNGTYGSENFDESIGMDEKEIDASLLDFGKITIASSSTEWKTSKIYTISGATTGTTLQYKIVSGTTVKQDWTNYSSAITVNWASTTKTPTYIYARLTDGVNTSDEKTYTETKIDTTAPTLTLGTSTTTTKNIVVPITVNKDDESGIKSTKCAYGTTSSLGTYGTISGNSCVINNVKSGTTYYYKVLTTNSAGLETSVVGNSTSKDFGTITIAPSSTAWKTSKTYTISGATTGATLQYKVVSGTTLKQDWTNYSSAITVNWSSTTKTPTYIYARLTDGVNTSDEKTYTETKIDTTAPTLTLGTSTTTTKNIVVPITVNKDDESGIKSTKCAYGTTSSLGTYGTISGNSCVINNVKSGTTYYYKVLTTNNAGLETSVVGNSTSKDFAKITITPSSTAWKTSKTYAISGTTTGATLQYKVVSGTTVKQDWTNYSSAITVNWASTTKTPTYIYARLTDGVNTSDETTYTETKIDTSTPNLTMSAVKSTSGSAVSTGTWSNETLKYTITSTGTHSSGVTIKYCVDTKNTCTPSTTIVSGKAFNLSNTGTYYVRYQGTTGAGKTNSIASYKAMVDTVAPTVSYSLASGTYNENKTVRVTVNDTNFKSMSVYVFKNKALVYTNKIASKSIDNTTKNTFDVLLDGDGDWTIYAKATDKAGNKQNQDPNNGDWYYQTYVIKSKETCLTSGDYKTGDAVTCGGYKWHVIRQYIESDDDLHPDPYNPVDPSTQTKYLTILMDAHQLPDMAHCTNDGTNCEINEHNKIKYSWENSLIRKYLNNTLLNELESKISNEIITNKICGATYEYNPTSTTSLHYFWGGKFVGYLESEIDRINDQWLDIHKYLENPHEQCKTYTYDKIRLITRSEHYLMHSTYEGGEYDYIAKIPNIKQMLPNYYKSWFIDVPPTYDKYNPFVPIVGSWWGMAGEQDNRYPYYGKSDVSLLFASSSLSSGAAMTDSSTVAGVRPVITIALD